MLQRVDEGSCDEATVDGEGPGSGGEGRMQAADSSNSSRPLGSGEETTLRAGTNALLSLIGTDLCLRLGLESAAKAEEARGKD